MKEWTLRLGLSLMVVVVFWAERAPAQEPPLFIVPTVPYDPDHHPRTPAAFYVRPQPEPGSHTILNHFGLGCQGDPWGTVMSFHQEMRWMFGSSRSFFGERCDPNQPCGDRRYQR